MKWFSANCVTDDRGIRRPLVSTRQLAKDADDAQSPRRELSRRLKVATQAMSQQHVGRFVAFIVLSSALVFVVTYLLETIFGPLTGALARPVFWFALVGGLLTYNSWILRRYSAQITSTVLAEGICGSCGYSLQGLAADPHGHLVCSECGAAWRESRIVRPHWEADRSVVQQPRPSRRQSFLLSVPREKMLLTPDDRGMFVRAVDSKLVLIGPEALERLGAERSGVLIQAMLNAGRRTRRIAVLLVAAWHLFTVMLIWNTRGETDEVVMIAILLFASLTIIVGTVVMFSSIGYKPGVGARILVADNLCGSCAADLSTLVPQDDGCVVCTACKAAWKPATVPPHTASA